MDTKEMHCYKMDFPITYITNKDAHNLWIGTINGLYQFNKVNQELKAVNLDSELGCINTIYQSKKNINFHWYTWFRYMDLQQLYRKSN